LLQGYGVGVLREESIARDQKRTRAFSQSSLIVAIADGVFAALSLQKESPRWNQVQENRVVQLQVSVRVSLANVVSSV
jgi:hypothetical protein